MAAVIGLLMAAAAFAFEPVPKESAKALGITRGKNISKGVTRGSTIMGAVGIGLDIYLQLKEDYDEALRKEALKSNRQNVRSTFNSAAKDLEDFSRQYVKENVYRPMEQSIASIDANIQNIRDTRDGKSSACVRLENIQTECSKLIEKLHQAALGAEA